MINITFKGNPDKVFNEFEAGNTVKSTTSAFEYFSNLLEQKKLDREANRLWKVLEKDPNCLGKHLDNPAHTDLMVEYCLARRPDVLLQFRPDQVKQHHLVKALIAEPAMMASVLEKGFNLSELSTCQVLSRHGHLLGHIQKQTPRMAAAAVSSSLDAIQYIDQQQVPLSSWFSATVSEPPVIQALADAHDFELSQRSANILHHVFDRLPNLDMHTIIDNYPGHHLAPISDLRQIAGHLQSRISREDYQRCMSVADNLLTPRDHAFNDYGFSPDSTTVDVSLNAASARRLMPNLDNLTLPTHDGPGLSR